VSTTRTVFVLWLSASGVIPGTLGHVLPAATQQIEPGSRFSSTESPDAETGRAVRGAVMQWKIRPLMGLAGKGILVFYFHLKGPNGVVLSPAEMREVTSPGAKNVKREDEPPTKHLTDAEFRALSTRPSTLPLDMRDRESFGEGHEKGAVNIPFGEVLTRAPAELPVSHHIVIDCRDPLDLCAMAVHWLVSNGFGQVSILQR